MNKLLLGLIDHSMDNQNINFDIDLDDTYEATKSTDEQDQTMRNSIVEKMKLGFDVCLIVKSHELCREILEKIYRENRQDVKKCLHSSGSMSLRLMSNNRSFFIAPVKLNRRGLSISMPAGTIWFVDPSASFSGEVENYINMPYEYLT